MLRGCIAAGDVRCDGCGRVIRHPERYLLFDEEEGDESEQGKMRRYCVECALLKGYAHYKEEKGKKVLTFFPQ